MLLKEVAEKYNLNFKMLNGQAILSNEYSELIFNTGSRWSRINNTNVALIFPVESSPEPCINEMDFKLTLEPLMRPEVLKKHKLELIMLDPGHGGSAYGCVHDNIKEKNLNLIYAEKLCKELTKSGYKAEMTRQTDKHVELEERADITAQSHADLFVSLHINALSSFESEAEGIENYCMTPAGGCSTNSGEVYGMKHTEEQFLGNEYDLNNITLAYCLQKAMIEATGAPDRSVRRANFSVLRNNSVPAVLVESGYLTNSKERKLLISNDYQDKIVKAIAQGIREYEKLLKSN